VPLCRSAVSTNLALNLFARGVSTLNRFIDRCKSGPVRAEDALRKIGLLRRVKTENGALAAEADNAARLAKALMERYAIKADDIPTAPQTPTFRMTWMYWQDLLHRFGLRLRHFGHRGNAGIGDDKIVYINLRTSQWWIEERTNGGWQSSVRDWGVESLHKYLDQHARGYSLFRR
jgi:hypothetical protein